MRPFKGAHPVERCESLGLELAQPLELVLDDALLLSGRVRTISADSFSDEKTGLSYFRAEIEVGADELQKVSGALGRGKLRPGLPVEVVLAVRKRTALQYLLEPLGAHFWRSFREQ